MTPFIQRTLELAKKPFSFDLRSLALYRICTALLIFSDLALRASDLRAFYTDQGVLPRPLLLSEFLMSWRVSVYLVSDNLIVVTLKKPKKLIEI